MKIRALLRNLLLVAAIIASLPMVGPIQVQAQGAPQGSPQMGPGTGMQHEVQGRIKAVDPSRRLLTLDDGTKLTIPPTVQLPGGIQEGVIVKASFEEQAGQNVVTSLEVQKPY